MEIISTKPYLIRAIFDWCVDQGFTPHIAAVVDEHVRVPPGFASDGQIVLDISAEAVNQLVMGNDVIHFHARFGGVAHHLLIPVGHVVAIYASENGHGMAFEPDLATADDFPATGLETVASPDKIDKNAAPDSEEASKDPGGNSPRPTHLKIVK